MKKKILLLVILVVILLGGGLAYAYFATDVFKTEKEIFFTYLFAEDSEQAKEMDNKLTEYLTKKETTPYSNDGEATIAMTSDDTTEGIDNVTVDFEGNTDTTNNLAEQTISVDLSQGVIIPIEFKSDGDTYGIQSDLLDTRYIAIRNENLKALAERFGIDATNLPDKIELESTQFTEDEIKTLKEKYTKILIDNLEEELFTKEKVNSETIITLKMPEAKVKEIFEKVLQALKDDEIILSKLPEASKTQFQDSIQQTLDEFSDTSTSENNSIEVKMYVEKRVAKKYEMAVIEESETVGSMVIEINDNAVSAKIYDHTDLLLDMNLSTEKVENDIVIKMTIKMEQDGTIMELNATMQYKNLFALDNVQETMDIEMKQEVNGDDYYYANSNTQVTLNYQNTITFSPDIQIEEFNEENAIIINDATDEELQTLLMGIYQNLGLM